MSTLHIVLFLRLQVFQSRPVELTGHVLDAEASVLKRLASTPLSRLRRMPWQALADEVEGLEEVSLRIHVADKTKCVKQPAQSDMFIERVGDELKGRSKPQTRLARPLVSHSKDYF